MLYLDDRHLRSIGLCWEELERAIVEAVQLVESGDYAQPVKPYLRYGNPANRIIAMPAYVGGAVQAAGLKWIASFPGNILNGLPRAHSVLLLNDVHTGIPYAMLNSPLPSAARTAAVSAVMLRHYLQTRPATHRIRLGIIGLGPIGQLHYDMCSKLFGEQIDDVLLYDIQGKEKLAALLGDGAEADSFISGGVGSSSFGNAGLRSRTRIVDSWQELYGECNVILTCTVSDSRYIDRPPLPGSLLLDVSLRDYKAVALERVSAIIVDDWNEVCRENTDIELLHLERALTQADTRSLVDVVCREALLSFAADEPVLFCPMGMAVFDMATAACWVQKAKQLGIGLDLAAGHP